MQHSSTISHVIQPHGYMKAVEREAGYTEGQFPDVVSLAMNDLKYAKAYLEIRRLDTLRAMEWIKPVREQDACRSAIKIGNTHFEGVLDDHPLTPLTTREERIYCEVHEFVNGHWNDLYRFQQVEQFYVWVLATFF